MGLFFKGIPISEQTGGNQNIGQANQQINQNIGQALQNIEQAIQESQHNIINNNDNNINVFLDHLKEIYTNIKLYIRNNSNVKYFIIILFIFFIILLFK